MDAKTIDPTMNPMDPNPDMDLRGFVKLRWGNGARLAQEMGIKPVLISQWIKGEEDRELGRTRERFEAGLCEKPEGRPVPAERAVAIEWHTGFQVRVETLWCPGIRWQRVPDPDWPHGKPLIDTSPKASQPPTPEAPTTFVDTQPESA